MVTLNQSVREKMQYCHSVEYHKELESAVTRLKDAGLKITRPRHTLLKAIMQEKAPFSVEQIFKAVTRILKREKCDLATVYRSLAVFEQLNIVTRCDFGDGIARYELVATNGHHHHHIICTSCQKVEALSFCLVEDQEQLRKKTGFANISHKLEFFGLCPSCST